MPNSPIPMIVTYLEIILDSLKLLRCIDLVSVHLKNMVVPFT